MPKQPNKNSKKGKTVSIIPETELIKSTVTLRLLDFPPSVKKTKRSLLRFFALSLGLISENETRTVVLPVLDSLFHHLFSSKPAPSTLDLQDFIKTHYNFKISEKLIRYHLQKLIDLHIILRKKNLYYLNNAPNAEKEDINALFDYWLKKDLLDSIDNAKEAFSLLEKSFSSK